MLFQPAREKLNCPPHSSNSSITAFQEEQSDTVKTVIKMSNWHIS